ncbi:type II toxin-antitoxin system HigB family toxin [Spirosoma daeguense]
MAMHIISVSTLKAFWEQHPDAEGPLRAWYSEIKRSDYHNPNEVIRDYPMADTVKNNRIVFNICHNKYRLVVTFRYKYKRIYIRFIGTHKEYDAIEDIANI